MKLLGMGTNPTNITTTPSALAVNTYPTYAKSFESQGRSLALNQQIYQIYNTIDPSLTGLTVTFVNGILSVSGTADVTLNIKFLDNGDLIENHKYYFNAPAGSSSSGYRPYFATSGDNYTTDSIITWTTGKGSFNIRVNGGTSTGFSYYPKFIDLTQMFGPGLEPTTVDQLKSVLDLDKYIPYNPGTFIHNNSTYEVNKWNQLMRPNGYLSRTSTGITYVNNNDGTVTMSGTATGTDNITYINISSYWIAGHKYLIGTSSKYSNKLSGNNISQNFTGAALFTYSSSSIYVGINVVNGTSYNDTWSVNFVDLTDIFGAGKEPSTVDECKLRFLSMGIDITKYQPYSPLGGQYCGYRNIWDEEWERGTIDANGNPIESASQIRSKNFCRCLDNASYYSKGATLIYWYDLNETFISRVEPSGGAATVTSPTGAYYFKIRKDSTTTYNKNDISIYQVSNKVDLGFNILDVQTFVKGRTDSGVIGYADGTSAFSIVPTGVSFTTNAGWRGVVSGEIPVSASTAYNISFSGTPGSTCYVYIDCYKSDGTFLDKLSVGTISSSATTFNQTFTTLANTGLVRLSFQLSSANSACFTNMCINLSQPDTTKSPHNGDYRPYLMLRGIGSDFNKLDLNREQGTLSGQASSTKRQFEENKYYVGLAYDNNFKSNEIDGYSISSSQISVNAKDGYGVAFPIRCLPNTTYYSYRASVTNYGSIYIAFYTQDGTWISGTSTNYANTTVTSPSTAYWIVPIYGGGGTSFSTRVFTQPCINLSQPQTTINPHNGQYVPHLFDTYDSMSSILTRRIGAVDLGAQTWSGGTNGKWRTTITPANRWVANNTKIHAFAEKYEIATANDIYYSVVTVPSIGGEDSDGHLYCYTGSSSIQPSGMFLYELVAYQVFTPTSKFGVVDMGSLSWTRVDVTGSGGYVFSTLATPLHMYKQSDNLWCSGYTTGHYTGTGSTIYNYGNKTIAQHTPSGEFNIYVRDDSYTSASDFTNAVKGKILTYELSDSVSQTTITQPISFVSGKLGKRYGVVDLGSLTWSYSTAGFFLAQNLPSPASTSWGTSQKPDVWTSRYLSDAIWNDITASNKDKRCSAYDVQVRISDSKFTDATAFKNSLQGQYLIYKLADSATNPTYATAGNLIRKINGDVGDVDFNLKYWEESQVKLIKVGNKFLAVNE